MGPLPCFFGASFIALGVVIWNDRRHARREAAEVAAAPGAAEAPRRQMSPLTAAGLTLGGVVVLFYVVFVIVTGLKGA